MEIKDKVIIALDYQNEADAIALVHQLEDLGTYYKVGLELFLNTKGSIIEFLKSKEKKVFLDLKFHDIPNTVLGAVKWAKGLDIDLFNVHALGGKKMMEDAKAILTNTCQKLIAVTILTSMDNMSLKEIGILDEADVAVKRLARLAYQSNLDGVVCSAKEAKDIKAAFGSDFLTVCPGIRPIWAHKGDQARVMTPYEAVKSGVDHMVIGRPITAHEKPKEALEKIIDEIMEAYND